MADEQLIVKILDAAWVEQSRTSNIKRCTLTRELGQVGEAQIEVDITNTIVPSLPDPDAVNPYEGRYEIYEGATLVYRGVIDARTLRIDTQNGTVTFGGKHRGIMLGFYNLQRRNFLGWALPDLFNEFLRTNIGASPFAAVSDVSGYFDDRFAPVNAISGDPFEGNYWASQDAVSPAWLTIDLGSIKPINGIRVITPWWAVGTPPTFKYQDYQIYTADNAAGPWTLRITKADGLPMTEHGRFTALNISCRYVKYQHTGSSDGFARLAQLMVYQNVASVGSDTTYYVPFIENDDSGNVTFTGGTPTRVVVNGAFNGDGIQGNSFVTQLTSGDAITHAFRGTTTSVYCTSSDSGASTFSVKIDGASQGTFSVPAGRWQYKAFEIVGLSPGPHTCEVIGASGTTSVDYFTGLYLDSWRVLQEDDPTIAYLGDWQKVSAAGYFNYYAVQSQTTGDTAYFEFRGDHFQVWGSKGPGLGQISMYINGSGSGVTNTASSTVLDRQLLIDWTGAYGTYTVKLVMTGKVTIDQYRMNADHIMYMRARYETNLRLATRMSEILGSWLRFNDDGSVSLLGVIGDATGKIIREGENEGGNMIQGSAEHDYTETGSAVLALVTQGDGQPIKAFMVDREAVSAIGLKIIKYENSDAQDGFMLARQAWQYLQDHKNPVRKYDVQYIGEPVQEGDTARLYSPKLHLNGDAFRVGKITVEYT